MYTLRTHTSMLTSAPGTPMAKKHDKQDRAGHGQTGARHAQTKDFGSDYQESGTTIVSAAVQCPCRSVLNTILSAKSRAKCTNTCARPNMRRMWVSLPRIVQALCRLTLTALHACLLLHRLAVLLQPALAVEQTMITDPKRVFGGVGTPASRMIPKGQRKPYDGRCPSAGTLGSARGWTLLCFHCSLVPFICHSLLAAKMKSDPKYATRFIAGLVKFRGMYCFGILSRFGAYMKTSSIVTRHQFGISEQIDITEVNCKSQK